MKKVDDFDYILKENKDSIYRICCYYLKNPDDRNDLFQEIIINIWKSLNRFEGKSKISTWIYRISINSAITYVLKENKRKKQDSQFTSEHSKSSFLYSNDENTLLEKKSQRLTLEINNLSVPDRTLVSLYMEGLDYDEISKITGMSVGNARVKLHRIKNELKKRLNENPYENE